jgi:uncharacterized protein GlcG (DUF336 family)
MHQPGNFRVLSVLEYIQRGLLSMMLLMFAGQSPAKDIITVKKLMPALALEMVQTAVNVCRNQGYQVTAVVVDRDGTEVALLRDVHASRFTIQLAHDKANAVILSGIASGAFREQRGDIRQEMNHVDGVLMLHGGLPVRAAGTLLGAIGVSGAPGGDKDEICAQRALDAVQERLEFAE